MAAWSTSEATGCRLVTAGCDASSARTRRGSGWSRHSGTLMEIDMNPELPAIDEGDLGRSYVSTKGEEVAGDHEAVRDAPGAFEPVDD